MPKLSKRDFANPLGSITIWIIPTLTYIMLSMNGVIKEDREWIWLTMIPLLFVLWIVINFKIKNDGIN